MWFFLRWDCFVDAAELVLNALDLVSRGFALLVIQLRGRRTNQSPLHTAHNRHHHFQIAQQFGAGPGGRFFLRLPLRFEKQLGTIEDTIADRG
jgi:hypothetical protein